MPDLSGIQPIAAIIGAIITATTAIVVAYFIVAKRKRVAFWIEPSIDLTLPHAITNKWSSRSVTAIS
jgi:hypothetical protein